MAGEKYCELCSQKIKAIMGIGGAVEMKMGNLCGKCATLVIEERREKLKNKFINQ